MDKERENHEWVGVVRTSRSGMHAISLVDPEGDTSSVCGYALKYIPRIERKMHSLRQVGRVLYNFQGQQHVVNHAVCYIPRCKIISNHVLRFLRIANAPETQNVATPLRNVKPKSRRSTVKYFLDMKQVRTVGGKGGNGEISFLRLWVNDRAGPDGGDGGHGGHVIFKVSSQVKDLSHVNSILEGMDGEKGYNKGCFGKNGEHTIVNVPMGTIVRDMDGRILVDLNQRDMMFIAARGGAGGHGNMYFKSDLHQTPEICEYGANGESLQYILEMRSMAHIGLIGLPNAGKSTLLRAVSRARPKVAPYPFTTLQPHVGMVLYDDYEQVAVADLPGLIEESHKNKGLGINFLKHVERCAALLFVLDMSREEPWVDLDVLQNEMSHFNEKLLQRPMIVAANKMDLPNAEENLHALKEKIDLPIIPISAKMGDNISKLLKKIKIIYDKLEKSDSS
ncbi:hypothetical protein KM043_007551 [Ampulex compressa]|nr:hypothetical protein KM043_007551 [Ampulex compressa]